MRAVSPGLTKIKPVSTCSTLSLRSAVRPIRVMNCLPQLLPPLCFTLGPFDPRESPPTAEDACRQSLQPTCYQRAPNDSTMFLSRQLALSRTSSTVWSPRRGAEASPWGSQRRTGRRNSPKRTPTSSAVRLTAHVRAAAQRGQALGEQAPEEPRLALTTRGIVRRAPCSTAGTAGVTCRAHLLRQRVPAKLVGAKDRRPSPAST
jgi:hypothetical protein